MSGIRRQAAYAVAVMGLGVMLLSSTFIYVWAPVPRWVPGRDGIAVGAGLGMLIAAAGLMWRRTVVASSALLTLLFLGWLLLLQVPRLAGAPSRELLWSGAKDPSLDSRCKIAFAASGAKYRKS